MIDISSISAGLNCIQTTLNIIKSIKLVNSTIDQADLKLKFAEITSYLADTKNHLSDAKVEISTLKDEIIEKKTIISNLKKSLNGESSLIRYYDALYKKNNDDKPWGNPYCIPCYEKNYTLSSLVNSTEGAHKKTCHLCKASFSGARTPIINEQGKNTAAAVGPLVIS